MKLERIKCKPLEKAKDICFSQSYIIGCTGQKAAIMDRHLNLVHIVDGLEYVYSAEVSPDETKLLLISNGNKFYIVDLHTFEKTRITVRAPYSYNLEGQGCWSFDGKSVLIPVQRSTDYINSTLRCYCACDFSKFKDYLPDKYCLTTISKVDALHSYFLTGYNRNENNRNYFIYFDGSDFREFPLDDSVDMVGPAATVDTKRGVVTLTSPVGGCKHFTFEGKEIKAISHPDPKNKTLRTSDAFIHLCEGNAEKEEKLKALCASLGMENIPAPDYINKYETSSCGNYIYLASQSGFYLLDTNTKDTLAFVPEEYGVENFEELAPGMIAITTWSGVKLYRICEQ